jgi:hypothetical protein
MGRIEYGVTRVHPGSETVEDVRLAVMQMLLAYLDLNFEVATVKQTDADLSDDSHKGMR